jgi:4-diphosphocytidyl-2-C-methyl-D-erythritol kinase
MLKRSDDAVTRAGGQGINRVDDEGRKWQSWRLQASFWSAELRGPVVMAAFKTVYAPAKVNFCLHVLNRRPDGYHNLAMLMQRVALYDRLSLRLVPGGDLTVSCPGLELPVGEVNIVERAARMLMARFAQPPGVEITVEKGIPAAAGLGGGSSDAAATLEALDELLQLKSPRSELMALGSRLGADVPFFLYKQTAWATGIGDRFEPWPGLPGMTLVLVNPGVAVSTAGAFQNLGLTHLGPVAKIPRFPVGTSGFVRLLHNDLEIVTCRSHPEITTIKDRLLALGAAGALMSGSGSTVFGVFAERIGAERAADRLSTESDWWIRVVDPL